MDGAAFPLVEPTGGGGTDNGDVPITPPELLQTGVLKSLTGAGYALGYMYGVVGDQAASG
jgi:hypothetical protein